MAFQRLTRYVNVPLGILASFVFLLIPSGIALSQPGTVLSTASITMGDTLDPYDNFGRGIASLGDLDGPGFSAHALAIGAPGDDFTGTDEGAIYIVFLNSDGSIYSDRKMWGPFDGGGLGTSLASLGDLDGPGNDNAHSIAVGVPYYGVADRGAVWIVSVGKFGAIYDSYLIDENELSGSLADNDHFGRAVASLGDLDGPGPSVQALAVASKDVSGGGIGAIWVLFLASDGSVLSEQIYSATQGSRGPWPSDDYAYSIASLGDIGGNGTVELAVGAPYDDFWCYPNPGDEYSNRGAVWILSFDSNGLVVDKVKIDDEYLCMLEDNDLFGMGVAAMGDLGGDRAAELAVFALHRTPSTSEIFLTDDVSIDFDILYPIQEIYYKWNAATWLGDLDGDGNGDMAIGWVWGVGAADRVTILFMEGAYCETAPPSLDFGTVYMGDYSDRSFTITNTSPDPLTGNISQPNCLDYSVVAGEGNYNLSPGEEHQVTVRFEPAYAGTRWCTIDEGSHYCGDIYCTGEAISCEVNPVVLDFGSVPIGGRSDLEFEIINRNGEGSAYLSANISETCGPYTVIYGGGWHSIAPGETLVVGVRFEPTTNGVHPCTIETGTSQCADVSCTGQAFTPDCSVVPSYLDFGNVILGDSQEKIFYVTNNARDPLTGNISESCDHYQIVLGGGPFNLDFGEFRRVHVRFEPQAAGFHQCMIETGDALCSDVACTGYGIHAAPVCQVDPASLNFGAVKIDATAEKSFTIENIGIGTLSGEVGGAAAPFSVISGLGPFSLVNPDVQQVTVRFAPASVGWVHRVVHLKGIICGAMAYVADGDRGLKLFGLDDPTSPVPVGSWDSPLEGLGVALDGSYAYLADSDSGLVVIDVGDPANPTPVGFLSTPDRAHRIDIQGAYAYVALGYSGLFVVEISDPANPVYFGGDNTPGKTFEVIVEGTLAYLADGTGGLRIYSVADPSSPAPVGALDFTPQAYGLDVSGNYAYVAADDSGLVVVDVSNPALPVEVGKYDTPGSAQGVEVAGGYAYVACGSAGLVVIDVSTPSSPVQIGSYDSAGQARDVDAVPPYVMLADGIDGLRVIDVSTPSSPLDVGGYNTDGQAFGVVTLGRVELTGVGTPITGVEDMAALPFELYQNHPNPFNPSTNIRFSLDVADKVKLTIFDIAGRHVRTLLDRPMSKGIHTASWDGTNARGQQVASGIYFYRLEASHRMVTKKMILLK